jgi:short-subunit dehydrogenase
MADTKKLGTAVVTGCTGAIGAGYARGLAERGYDLLLVGRSRAALDLLAARLRRTHSGSVRTAPCDLADADDLEHLVALLEKDSALTLLANIASAVTFSAFSALSAMALRDTVTVNCTAPTRLIRAVAPGFIARGHGTIVNFASILAFRVWPEFNVHAASKAFLVSLSEALRAELARHGVLVQVVVPPPTDTTFWKNAGLDVASLPRPAVMARNDLIRAALAGLDRREDWVFPSLADVTLLDRYRLARDELVLRTMSGSLATRYTAD